MNKPEIIRVYDAQNDQDKKDAVGKEWELEVAGSDWEIAELQEVHPYSNTPFQTYPRERGLHHAWCFMRPIQKNPVKCLSVDEAVNMLRNYWKDAKTYFSVKEKKRYWFYISSGNCYHTDEVEKLLSEELGYEVVIDG